MVPYRVRKIIQPTKVSTFLSPRDVEADCICSLRFKTVFLLFFTLFYQYHNLPLIITHSCNFKIFIMNLLYKRNCATC